MNALIDSIRDALIGENISIKTPFGDKPMIYADYTASGRSLDFIEDFIRNRVLPFYANTHSESSYTGAQIGTLREQARKYIRQSVNAKSDDCVIFCGSGATAAIHKLIDMLNLRLPTDLDERYLFSKQIPVEERPVVFIGPYEHHSNELPWRESIVDVVTIPLTDEGCIDVSILKDQLQRYQSRPLKMASFSAASNVTGIKTDVDLIGKLLHQHEVLSFWDYAAAAPYVAIDMSSHKDAVFISPHKFVGGPSTPGVLVVNKNILKNRVPSVAGGGTVVYVTPESHRYTDDVERKEEAGTPGIIESIRAGLVFKLQHNVGIDEIEKREREFVQRALTYWKGCKNIEILGNINAPRLAIFSLRIRHQKHELHYGYIVALLNDLFGIQARGGCSCAGPYGHNLLNLNMERSKKIESQLMAGQMILRPGWVRLSFNYFIDENTFDYLLQAIELIANHGWRLLPYYHYDNASGTWRYQNKKPQLATDLDDLNFSEASTFQADKAPTAIPKSMDSFTQCIAQAKEEMMKSHEECASYLPELSANAETLRWFSIPA